MSAKPGRKDVKTSLIWNHDVNHRGRAVRRRATGRSEMKIKRFLD